MDQPLPSETKEKIQAIHRAFQAVVRKVRHEHVASVEKTMETVDKKRAEQIRGQIKG